MNAARLELSMALLSVSLGLVAAQRVRAAVTPGRIPEPVVGRASMAPVLLDADSLAAQAAMIIENDVFRLTNRPSSVPYTLAPPPNVERPAAVRPVRPTLALRAVMGGPPWLAVVDGLPGGVGDGVTVRAGDTFDKLLIRSVGRDTVIVQAPDTIWKLTIPRRR